MADEFSFAEDEYLLVGKVTKPHGLHGEVKIFPFSEDAQTLLQYPKIVLVDRTGRLSPVLRVEKARVQGKTVVVKLDTVNDRNEAEALQGKGILVFKEDLPAAGEDEFYWYQLYDLPVFTDAGERLGVITSIFSNGAQDIMVVEDDDNEYLIPILDTIIKEQTEEGVVISPPTGLLEINSGSSA